MTCHILEQGPVEAGVLEPFISPKDAITVELPLQVKCVKQVDKLTFLSNGYTSVSIY